MSVAVLSPLRTGTDPRAFEEALSILAAGAAESDATGRANRDGIAALARSGVASLTVPRQFGGQGAGLSDSLNAVRSIASADPSAALILAMQFLHHAGLARRGTWPTHLHAAVARGAAERGELINALRVEPDLGTPARGGLPATVARRVATGWRLDGHKTFSTGIPVLTWLAVWARTDEEQPRVGTFLVPAAAPGITVEPRWDQLGMRATESHDVHLDGVGVPADHAVDIRPPANWTTPDAGQAAWNAILIGGLYLAIAGSARDWLGRWLHGRVPANLGASLATVPRLQQEFGAIDQLVRLDERLLRSAAEATDAGTPPDVAEAGLIKQRATADAIAAVERAVAISGGAGLSRSNPLERLLRDVLCGRVHTPQDDSVLVAAGRAALSRLAPNGTGAHP